jgi:diguanylate cyclase (GGDEF)-like protein
MNYQKESELRIEEIDRYQWALLFIILLTLLIEGMYIFRPLFRKLIDYMLKLTKMASIDELTGLLNRRVFNEKLAEAYALVKRYNNDYTIVMFDIDNFKNINDTYDHSAGDEAIKSVASIILNHSRNTDYCFRTGGEEFIVLLPQTGLDDAIQFAERCRASVQNSQHSQKINTQLTLSGGVAEITKSYIISPLEQVDKALYRAKFIGRNVIVKYENNWDLPSEELT